MYLLASLNLDFVKIPSQSVGAKPETPKNETIWTCCENINEKIRQRKTFEIFGRKKEIDRAFEVLLRKNKSNITV